MKTRIYIASTEKHPFPKSEAYVPMAVGMAKKPSWARASDNEGKYSISAKNPYFCELTAHYAIWKNDLAGDAVGLCHYRRYLWLKKPPRHLVQRNFAALSPSCEEYLDTEALPGLLERYDILLPVPCVFSSDNVASHFARFHGEGNFNLMTAAVNKITPEVMPTLRRVFERRYASLANMLIARKEIFDEYSAWLFGVLFEMERHADMDNPDTKRLFGYSSERLLNVYAAYRKLAVGELPMIFIGDAEKPDGRVNLRYLKRRYLPGLMKFEEGARRLIGRGKKR